MLRYAGNKADCAVGGFRRLVHSLAQPAPLATAINHSINTTLPPFVSPENHDDNNMGSHFFDSPFFRGAMELMAVPKRKVILSSVFTTSCWDLYLWNTWQLFFFLIMFLKVFGSLLLRVSFINLGFRVFGYAL